MKKMTAPIPFVGSQFDQTRHVFAFFNSGDEEYRVLLPWGCWELWCPNKVSKTLKTALGLVVIFIKKQTWWQPHVAGELSFRDTLRIVGRENSRVLSMSPPIRQLPLDQ
jgi:hypothetical protein